MLIIFQVRGVGVPRTGYLWAGGEVLEERHQRDSRHQDPEKPSQLCSPGTD